MQDIDWVQNVIVDLKSYCETNGLDSVAIELGEAARVFQVDVKQLPEKQFTWSQDFGKAVT